MEGKLKSPMLICLQEFSGQFPRTIQLRNYENFVIRCSKFGKLDKRLIRDFFQNVFKPIVERNPEKKAVLVVDSWGVQKSDELYQDDNVTVLLKILPEGSTGFMQPLDLFCLHQWKDFIKRFTEHAFLSGNQTLLHRRENIWKIYSLILNQFQSPVYQPIFRYA
jgi:hypothetical protein